jgi:hypothetical protein
MQLSLTSYHFIPLRSKYTAQHSDNDSHHEKQRVKLYFCPCIVTLLEYNRLPNSPNLIWFYLLRERNSDLLISLPNIWILSHSPRICCTSFVYSYTTMSRQHTGDKTLVTKPTTSYQRLTEHVFIFAVPATYDPVILCSILCSASRSVNERARLRNTQLQLN